MEIINVRGIIARIIPPGIGHLIAIIVSVHRHRDADLFEITDALGSRRLGLRPRQCGQQHSGENGDNRDDHQQLNQRERPARIALERCDKLPVVHGQRSDYFRRIFRRLQRDS